MIGTLENSHALDDRTRIEEEILFMESRLEEMGFEGDCAYERAMSKFYQEQLAFRRAQIAGFSGRFKAGSGSR